MKNWILLLILLLTVSMLIGETLEATAQVQPPRRKQRMLVTSATKKEKNFTVDIGKNLKDIAKRAIQHAPNPKVDVVFVVDGSWRMSGVIAELEKHIVGMLGVIESKTMDYRFGLVGFQSVQGEPRVSLHPWQLDYLGIENALRALRVESGNNVESGYGLDALMEGLNEFDFREDAATQFVVVSNSRMRTSWPEAKAKNKVATQLTARCHQNNVHLNFIGISEKVQAELTDETGGKWYPIDASQRPMTGQKIQSGDTIADKALLRVDGLFKRIAEHLVDSRPGKVDVVFVFDYSLSMERKVDAACDGVDRMVSVFNAAGLDYRFGLIRFWAGIGGGESTVVVTRPGLEPKQVKSLFRLPKMGDEHLLDAIMEGVPKLRTPTARELVLVIVTDETTSQRRDKGYTAGKAIAVCRGARARVYVIGGVGSMSSKTLGDNFQRQVAQLTKGIHYIMPGATIADPGR